MKFIIDQQLPPVLTGWFIAHGHAAEHVREIGLRDAEDRLIWERAERDGAVIVTKDEDFARLRSVADAGPVIVWLRVGDVATRFLIAWLDARWPGIEAELQTGTSIVEVR